jgi:hypothetical protein
MSSHPGPDIADLFNVPVWACQLTTAISLPSLLLPLSQVCAHASFIAAYMASTKPRIRQQKSRLSKPHPPPITGLVRVEDAPQRRQPYGTGRAVVYPEPLVFGPGGPYVQPDPPARIHSPRPFPGEFFDDNASMTAGSNPGTSRHAVFRKKERQWARWQQEVIPSLVQPYLRLIRETDSLRNMAGLSPPPPCVCGGEDARSLEVARISFHSTLSLLTASHINNDIQV